MKVRLSEDRTWNKLSPAEQKRLLKAFDDQENRDVMIVLDAFLKISCWLIHRDFGFGEKRLFHYLSAWRGEMRNQARFCRQHKQNEVLDAEMRKIFRKGGYPDFIFSSVYQDWNIDTNKAKDGENNGTDNEG